MTKLSPSQRIGLALLFGGFTAYIASALLLPSWRVLWLMCWGISLVGTIVYAWGTIPSLVLWIKRLRK